MKIQPLEIADVLLIKPRVFEDSRGHFFEVFNRYAFEKETGLDLNFIQDNESFSEHVHTVRGLHFQSPPHAQGKLVRCTSGALLDVAVDARRQSPTYGRYVKAILSEKNKAQLWIPPGFLHGFATLMPRTIMHYKCTDVYDAACDGAVAWNDPQINIDWGFEPSLAHLSKKDLGAGLFNKFNSPFKI